VLYVKLGHSFQYFIHWTIYHLTLWNIEIKKHLTNQKQSTVFKKKLYEDG